MRAVPSCRSDGSGAALRLCRCRLARLSVDVKQLNPLDVCVWHAAFCVCIKVCFSALDVRRICLPRVRVVLL